MTRASFFLTARLRSRPRGCREVKSYCIPSELFQQYSSLQSPRLWKEIFWVMHPGPPQNANSKPPSPRRPLPLPFCSVSFNASLLRERRSSIEGRWDWVSIKLFLSSTPLSSPALIPVLQRGREETEAEKKNSLSSTRVKNGRSAGDTSPAEEPWRGVLISASLTCIYFDFKSTRESKIIWRRPRES